MNLFIAKLFTYFFTLFNFEIMFQNDKKIKDLEKLKQLKLDMQTDKQFMQKEKLREKIRYFYLKIKESENYIVSLYEKKYSKLILSRFEDKSLLMVI